MRRLALPALTAAVVAAGLGPAAPTAAADAVGPVVSQRTSALLVHDPLRIRAQDPDGVAAIAVDIPGHGRVTATGVDRLTVPAPAGRGWSRGRRAVFVTAVDNAGNATSRRVDFEAVESFGLPCGRAAAVDLVVNTPRIQDALGLADAALVREVRLAQTRCVDLDGDHVRGLVALLRARDGGPTPLVVARVSAKGVFRPGIVSVRHRIRRLAADRRVVVGHVRGGTVRIVADGTGRPVLRVSRG